MDREFAERMYKDWLEIHHKEDNEKSQEEYNYYLSRYNKNTPTSVSGG